jgi:hypothetical protein
LQAKDLLKKFISKVKNRKGEGDSKDMVIKKMTAILKKINPDKQSIKGDLYFSLKHK